jgi:nucleotide-binding universal stress UspA family protein
MAEVKERKMFKKILVPLDGSSLAECVLPHAVILAKKMGAELVLIHVVEQQIGPDRVQVIDPINWRLRRVEAEIYLDEVTERLRAAEETILVETVVLEGQAAERITEFAHEHEIDLIALSSHGRSGLSGWNISSIGQKIILRAGTSVLIVRAYHQPAQQDRARMDYRRILVPLDGSQRAEYVLPVLTPLAQEQKTEFVLVHVVARPEVPRRVPLTPEESDLIEKLVSRNQEEATKYLDQLKTRLPGNIQTRVVVSDSVAFTLHNLAEEEMADLVVLGAHGYSGKTRHPYGGVGISFIAYGTTPLLIVQDLPQQEIEPSEAEVAADEAGSRNGGWKIIYDKPAT